MLIPRKEKGQRETYRCKLGIHAWVTEHWWELRQRPQYYKKYRTRTYCRICGKKKNENKESKSSKR